GGTTRTLDGKPLAYGKRNRADDEDFANPHFIASGSAATGRRIER
ncbi:MAG: 3'(2'),5'-bisphosphate nucleotidase CysQ, partial [Mesorhizobium sp.]